MKTETEAAIKKLTEAAGGADDSNDALKLSQAALNLAHVEATLWSICKESKT